MKDFELRFAEIDLDEKQNCANIFNDPRLNGWYLTRLETIEKDQEYIDTIVRFRMPSPVILYKDILRNFTQEERKAGIHRMLIGKDLQDQIKEILEKEDSLEKCLGALSEEEVRDLLNKMEKILVFDCNRIPYLHIRKEKKEEYADSNVIKDFILSLPEYLTIFRQALNEEISISEATTQSLNVILNELIELKGN